MRNALDKLPSSVRETLPLGPRRHRGLLEPGRFRSRCLCHSVEEDAQVTPPARSHLRTEPQPRRPPVTPANGRIFRAAELPTGPQGCETRVEPPETFRLRRVGCAFFCRSPAGSARAARGWPRSRPSPSSGRRARPPPAAACGALPPCPGRFVSAAAGARYVTR